MSFFTSDQIENGMRIAREKFTELLPKNKKDSCHMTLFDAKEEKPQTPT